MVDPLKTTISLMCKSHPHGRQGMAKDLGMTLDQFNNHLYQKCGSRFFTFQELLKMEDLSRTTLLTEFCANRKRLSIMEIPKVENIDKVDLFDNQMQVSAADGELASAKIAAAADGFIDTRERAALSSLFNRKIRHQIHGFMAFLALYGVGVTEHSVDIFMENRRVEVTGVQIESGKV